jgi:hypothetical protein
MRLSAAARRVLLSVHLLSGLGWFGAVAAYVALAATGLNTESSDLARGCYRAMAVVAWWVVVPFSLLAASAGLVQAAGTAWGLARHWWVLLKLILTLLALVALLVHMAPTSLLAKAAEAGPLGPALWPLRLQLLIAPSAALVVLAATAVLGVVKPRGLTPFAKAPRLR